MSRHVLSCAPDDALHVVCQTMTDEGLQNMPVLDAHSVPLGVLDVRDAMQALLEQDEQERQFADSIAGVGDR